MIVSAVDALDALIVGLIVASVRMARMVDLDSGMEGEVTLLSCCLKQTEQEKRLKWRRRKETDAAQSHLFSQLFEK